MKALVNLHYSLIQYIACDKPVTASLVRVNQDVVASTTDELLSKVVAKGMS